MSSLRTSQIFTISDIARLMMSNTTVCAASSFCFWPSLAAEGTVHFPLTNLIGTYKYMLGDTQSPFVQSHALWVFNHLTSALFYPFFYLLLYIVKADPAIYRDRNKTLPYFGPNFHWIRDPEAVCSFTTPNQDLLNELLREP
jgi:hypothetical protein